MKVTVLLVVTVTPARSFLPGRPGLFPWMKLHTCLAVSRLQIQHVAMGRQSFRRRNASVETPMMHRLACASAAEHDRAACGSLVTSSRRT